MRLFAALPPPDRTLRTLAEWRDGWRDPAWPVRWVRPASLHVTLRFFGEVPEAMAPALGRMLDDAGKDTGLLVLEPTAVRSFPGGARARVVWLELWPEPALELLAHRVEQGSTALGLAPAREPFRPHVTLGRVERTARLPREAAARVAGAPLPAPFSVGELHLMESHLGSGPPRYAVRHVSALAA